MQKCCIYKIKEESKELFSESNVSEYVYVEDFAHNPIYEGQLQAAYRHIFIDTLMPTSQIIGLYVLPCDEFQKHFVLYMGIEEINEKIRELDSRE